MNNKQTFGKKLSIVGFKALHLLFSLVAFYVFWLLFRYGSDFPARDIDSRYNYIVLAGYAVGLLFFLRTYNAYLLGYSRIRELVFAEFLSQLFATGITYVMVSIALNQWRAPGWLLVLLAADLVFDVLWAYGATGLFFLSTPARRTILIYRSELDKRRFGSILGKPTERLYTVEEELRYDGSFHELKDRLEGYDAVFVAGVNSRCRNGILKWCKERGVPCSFLPHVGDVIMQEARHIQSFDVPVMFVERNSGRPEFLILKRAFDVVSSAAVLIVLSPVMLVTALAIRLYDGGPALYKQVRLTRDGREFEILKFRSMRVDAEKDGVARLSSGDNDDRITPIGRVIRKCRLDELPQLINILKGDMSVVGPRPERPEIAAQYYGALPEFGLRLQVKAGLTGYAQVYGKYNTDPYEKLEFDLLYIRNMSALTDLMLIFATFSILFLPESTEGVATGQTTAMDYDNEELRAKKRRKTGEHWAD